MSDVGKMINSCSDKQATAERPFQERAPSPCGVGLPSEEAVLCPAANVERQMLHKNFFLMVISARISVLSCRRTKHDNQCEQHKPPSHRPLQKVSWSGGRPKGFQSFPASKSMCLGTRLCLWPVPHPYIILTVDSFFGPVGILCEQMSQT